MSEPAQLPAHIQTDYERWLERKNRPKEAPRVYDGQGLGEEMKRALREAFAKLPDHVEIPYELTPVGERMAKFKAVCPPEFMFKIDRARLPNPAAFDRVAQWNGQYPGPLASGGTGSAKTRAAWSALGRLGVRENRGFTWFTTKRLTESYFEYHMDGEPERFWRRLNGYHVILFDDLDKLEMNDRNATMVFELYDWIYRERRPVITTTNRDREWWVNKMGDAFVRRLFDEAHFYVQF
jgi:hypothetical protein